MDTCGFGQYDVARALTSETEEWLPQRAEPSPTPPATRLVQEVVLASGFRSAFPFHLENSASFARHGKTNTIFFNFKHHYEQIYTDLRGQGYLQPPSSKPCLFAHSPNCILYLFSSRHAGALHTMDRHLVIREAGKQTGAGATGARAWTCEGEML